jgi:hypothetical protein
MKKFAVVLALMVLSLALFIPFTVYIQSAQAQTGGYSIQTVTHEVHILYSGQVIISDTIQVTGTMPSIIQVGLPFQYTQHVIEVEAYDSNNNKLTVTAGVSLQDRSGFYGTTIDLSDATSNTFTVIFVLSNDLLAPGSSITRYNLNYPAYPSLTLPAATVNTTLVLPAGVTLTTIQKEDGAVNATSYQKSNLSAFTAIPANATLNAAADYLQVATINSLDRNVNVNPSGTVTSADKYTILNNGVNSLRFFKLNLPLGATNVVARDQFGRSLSVNTYDTPGITKVANVTFIQSISIGSLSDITIEYTLPNSTSQQSGQFVLDLTLYPYFNYYIESMSATITPPEGASLLSPPPSAIISRNAFQESLTVTRSGVTYTDSIYNQETVQAKFVFSPLWIAFRPTIWMWVIAAVGAAIVAFMTRPKAKATPAKTYSPVVAAAVGVSSDQIRTFVESYEEKLQIDSEIRSLENRVQRGRIPRRRYKERRASLEGRMMSLNKTIDELKAVLRSSGGDRADIMRKLDASETNLNEVNQELLTLEAQRNVGEVSIEDYKQQLADLERRKAKAENTINGLMLRLRGEIR